MNIIHKIIHSSDLFTLADNLDMLGEYALMDGDEDNKLLVELSNALDKHIKVASKRENAYYRVLEGWQGVCAYLDTYWDHADRGNLSLMSIWSIIQDIRKNFIAPRGKRISKDQIDFIMGNLESHFQLFSKLFVADDFIDIVLLEHTYKEFNSKVNLIEYKSGILKERLFASYVIPEINKPAEITFLHELGHIIHHRLTRSAVIIPERFKALIISLFGLTPEFKQLMNDLYGCENDEQQVTEFFADCFAIAASKCFIPSLSCDYIDNFIHRLVIHMRRDSCLFTTALESIKGLVELDIPDIIVLVVILGNYFISEVKTADV